MNKFLNYIFAESSTDFPSHEIAALGVPFNNKAHYYG